MKRFFSALALGLALEVPVTAQIVDVGPFAGANLEEFDNQLPGGRILQNTATIAPSPGGQMILPQSWLVYVGYTVTAMAQSNSFLGTSVGHAVVTFDDPVQRFGAYFATVGYVSGGYALIYDDNGNLIANKPLVAPRGMPWTWDGWDAGGGPKFKRIELFANDPYNGGALLCIDNATCDIWLGTMGTRPTGCSGLSIVASGLPELGDTVQFQVTGGSGFRAIGLGLPIDVALPQCPGCRVGVDALVLGGSTYVLDIPNNPAVLDATISAQAFGIAGSCLGFLQLGDTADVRIGINH